MVKKNEDLINAVILTSEEVGGEVRDNYSGRFMFGKTCYGINCANASRCIEVAGKNGLTGAKWDNLGREYIVYWPHVTKE